MTTTSSAADINAYVQQAVAILKPLNQTIYISVSGYIWVSDTSYSINHSIKIGDSANELRLQGGDLVEIAQRLLSMWQLREGITQPYDVAPMLPAPQQPPILYAEFDDVPF